EQDRHDHPDRCRLPGAIGPDESVERAAGNDQIEALHRRRAAERLPDAFELDRGFEGHRFLRVRDWANATTFVTVFQFRVVAGTPSAASMKLLGKPKKRLVRGRLRMNTSR